MDDRVLTMVVGWDIDNPLHEQICNAAHKIGWDTQPVVRIEQDDMAENNLAPYFSDYVLWRRSIFDANDYENDRVRHWVNKQCHAPMNTHVVGSSSISSDKYFQHGVFSLDDRLKEYILPMYVVCSRNEVKEFIKQGKIDFPFIIKDRIGSIGKNITLIRNMEELDEYKGGWYNMTVESYIEADCDWRVFVIGGVAIGMMRKCGDPKHPENFMAKSGGRTRYNETRPLVRAKLARIAEDVAAAIHLEYAGVDIIQDKNTGKYYVLEVNLAAGWRNKFIETTGADVALAIAEWFQSRRDLRRLSVAEAVDKYLKKHQGEMTRTTRLMYQQILDGKENVAKGFASERSLEEMMVAPLSEQMKWLYDKVVVRGGDLIDDEMRRIKRFGTMVTNVAEKQVSWAGNFIGADTLEDGAISSARYLAVVDALKM